MKYIKKNIVKEVSSYLLKDNFLIFDSGKELRKHQLYLNDKNIGLEGISDYFYHKSIILFNKWDSDNSFSYNLKTDKIEVIVDNKQVVSVKDYIIYEDVDEIFHYKNENFIDVFSSKYFFNILGENYGITYSETHLSKINFQDEILWQFPLSSLGGSVYEPDKTDEIDKILGIAHGNVWFYTHFGRLVALELETGTKVYSLDCFGVYLDEKTKNIFAIASNTITIIDTEKLTIAERYNFLEADPTGIGAYRRVFSPLLQGDYFTFLGEKEKEYGGIGWVGIFDYKARKLIWEYEVISQEERNATRNQLVISQPLYMSDNKLYIKDIKDNLHIFERDFLC